MISEHILELYHNVLTQEFPDEKEFGISFLADSEEYATVVEPITQQIGVTLGHRKNSIKIISYYDYNENLLNNTIFSEVNRCYIEGKKFLKIITPLFMGDTHDIILAPNQYILDILNAVKRVRDFKINTSIHAPLVGLPLEDLKREVLDFLDNQNFSEFCKKYSIKQKRGIIFSGPPGNGKTITLSWLKSQALQRKIDFTAYKNAKDYMEDSDSISARSSSKKIIVFEEFDTYLQERDIGLDQERIESNQVLGSLLQTLDGIEEVNNVVFIFTTNFPQSFDSAIMRPGRIDKVFNFNAPDEPYQIEFLKEYLSDYSDDSHSLMISSLKKSSVKISFALLKRIVDDIRIHEFWIQQHSDIYKLDNTKITDIISEAVTNANRGCKVKSLKESII